MTRSVILLVIAAALVLGVLVKRIDPLAAIVVFALSVAIVFFLAGASL